MEAPLALYRRYRPETFAEVIGQDHVTAPLRNALSNNRVNHAYLFSGPRGCGKTTSARILARAINCEKGPTPEPCGVCKSCTDLARGGPGSIDVIEIDAASHGGVDDARDLRERAFFAPVESRYKIYIIDEAHMVTTQGFNALLKLVEEPPPHLKFIFATTEPDKVIGTIRSRTHHYPFRLVPPKLLGDYMATLCEAEGVAIAPAALPLVVRAGAGSVRDSLSVLDQLIGGAGPEGVTYELAVDLLGFTPDSLLDACVDGFAAHDSRAVFETIEKVIETGQDPKRFAEDLLRRLRDLVILSAVPNAVTSGLIEAAEDQGERLQTQAAGIGAAELTRAADIVAAGLLEMRGATAPRLQLELICAKVLLPGADDSTNGIQARLDRMERRLTITPGTLPTSGGAAEPAPAGTGAAPARQAGAGQAGADQAGTAHPGAEHGAAQAATAPPVSAQPGGGATTSSGSTAGAGQAAFSPPDGSAQTAGAPSPAAAASGASQQSGAGRSGAGSSGGGSDWGSPQQGGTQGGAQVASPAAASVAPAQAAPPSSGSVGLADVRRLWPEVLEAVKTKRRFAWIMLSQNAQVIAIDDQTLTLGLVNAGARESFARSGSDEILRQALIDTIGLNRRVEAVVDPSTDPGAGGGGGGGSTPPQAPRGGPSNSSWDQPPRQNSSWDQPTDAPSSQPGPNQPAPDQPAPGPTGNEPTSGPAAHAGSPAQPPAATPATSDAGDQQRNSGSSSSSSTATPSAEAESAADAGGPGANHAATNDSGGQDASAASSPASDQSASAGAPSSSPGGQPAGPQPSGASAASPSAGSVPSTPSQPTEAQPSTQAAQSNAATPDLANTTANPASTGAPTPAGGTTNRSTDGSKPSNGPTSSGDQVASKWRAAEAAVAAEQAERARLTAERPAPEAPMTPEEEAEVIGDDDMVLEEDNLTHTDLLREALGAQLITEDSN
ncbi:DNA polymerase-3 subunit gamma/tau [Kribbella amoyensis]|uniref:DNA-directed DNA polymerase n=1 Tax=Kribbella amoyensis TaxID=996641 RepID=A0A561BQ12_9ACTN|nr:DNA polymerase III subunit gamma and tau [Kribbella amoyensis]TWD80979.1 DNA polymerase-3 subunit gamma/tau [Kribbella amoyensis]